MKFLRFLSYNNAVPITISLVLLGAGSAFAASNPDALYTQAQEVQSVDNTYIANKDLDHYTPSILIKSVTEDADYYYVTYSITTIDLEDFVWKDVLREDMMKVSKDALDGHDLGLFVTDKLKNIIDNQLVYLRQVQEKERANVSQKTIATTYGGLVGQFLNATTETLPGYTPVVEPPAPTGQSAAVVDAQQSPAPDSPAPTTSTGSSIITLQLLGNNPAVITVGDNYADLGVVVLPATVNVGVHYIVDDIEVPYVVLDTRQAGTHTIVYKATDENGGVATAVRTVEVKPSENSILQADTSTTTTP